MLYIYVIYILLYIQGGKHAASACKGGTYPHKEGSTRKRERMIRGEQHKRKIALVHRGRTRGYGSKRGGGILKVSLILIFYNNPFFTISEKRIHCGVTVTKQVLINTTKNKKSDSFPVTVNGSKIISSDGKTWKLEKMC
jgi:hypothetical protein